MALPFCATMAAHSCCRYCSSLDYPHPSSLSSHRSGCRTALFSPIRCLSFTPRSSPPPSICRSRTLGKLRAHGSSGESSGTPVVSTRPPAQSNAVVRLTYLEGNSWLWDVGSLNILVDPVLVGNLDFGIPWLYDAAKKFLKRFRLEDLPELDCLLITQSLDDHCHVKTLKPLAEMLPDLRVIATLNAEPILSSLFKNITYLEPGQSCQLQGRMGSKLEIHATAGPILGPPWQRPENGGIS